jgi:glycosyltransferase involved in cell wall biosynthesis
LSTTLSYNDFMRVGLDISQVAHQGGVATYTKNLSEHLQRITDLQMVYFYSSLRKPYRGQLRGVKKFKLPPTLFELLFNKLRNVGIEKFIGPVDVFHSSDWTEPPTKSKKVTTYHDVVPLKYPTWSHPQIVDVAKRRLRLVEKEVDMVIAVSNTTKKDLMEISKIPSEKIVVIYEGVGEDFKPQDSEKVEAFRKRMSLPEEFVLAIGGIGERRNLKRVREACKKYSLVVTGETIPYVSEEEMPLLYASAKVLLYPSFYEGFGLPILEAMAVGTPVITSSVSSMSEVGGEAVEYVNPESVIDIENKLRFVWSDQKKRDSMIKKGFLQAKKFSWEKCAKETAEVYRKLLG